MKISIITPCYNSEKTIRRTIKSVINQKLDNDVELEYIIVDGKSKDGTLDIIKEFSDKYDNIKFISERDNSMTEALNKGFKMATGDILASVNADDTYIDGALNKICNEFKKNQRKKILMANTFFVFEESGKIKSKNRPRFFNPIISSIVECPFPECGVFFRKECFENVGYFNEDIKYTQDYELYLRLYDHGYKFNYLDEDISNFYISDTNYSSTISDKMEKEVLSYIKYKKTFKFFAESTLSKIIKAILAMRIYNIKQIFYKNIVE